MKDLFARDRSEWRADKPQASFFLPEEFSLRKTNEKTLPVDHPAAAHINRSQLEE